MPIRLISVLFLSAQSVQIVETESGCENCAFSCAAQIPGALFGGRKVPFWGRKVAFLGSEMRFLALQRSGHPLNSAFRIRTPHFPGLFDILCPYRSAWEPEFPL